MKFSVKLLGVRHPSPKVLLIREAERRKLLGIIFTWASFYGFSRESELWKKVLFFMSFNSIRVVIFFWICDRNQFSSRLSFF